MAYRMAPVLVTLNDLEGHSPVQAFSSAIRRTFVQYFTRFSTDSALTRSLSDSWASCFFIETIGSWTCDEMQKHVQLGKQTP